ncbi:hypothetical protein NPX13_g9645 [Xylaria arbuscula]|uniref:Uncharacterized protein n=1 Tax=Xylaria arbuscula TaxID=114810 RepID=A0A9W8N6J2_9PEZI|nr:hypothetical protein NPX13_g9645 [Xylaria arbuscula]
MDIDNLIKSFENMHISDQPMGSRESIDTIMVDRPTSPILYTIPDDNQLGVSKVPRVISAGVPVTPGILPHGSALIRLDSYNTSREIPRLAHKLLTNYTVNRLIYDSEVALRDWLHLLEITTLPSKIASSDLAVASRLRLLDTMIAGNHGRYVSRLAHIQFLHVMESLEAIIAKDRLSGLIEPQRDHESPKNMAYLKYQQASTRPLRARQLYKLKRYCERYQTLAGPSPLFILAYTDSVDVVVKSFTSDNLTIRQVARFIEENVPRDLIHLCDRLAKIADNHIALFFN